MKRGEFCPFLKKACIEHKCKQYVHLTGTHPQTGQPVDEFDCSFAWMPVLLIEGAKETRQAAAAVESLRNRIVDAAERREALAPPHTVRLIESGAAINGDPI